MAGAGVTACPRQSAAIRVGADRVMSDTGCAIPQYSGSPALRTLALRRAYAGDTRSRVPDSTAGPDINPAVGSLAGIGTGGWIRAIPDLSLR